MESKHFPSNLVPNISGKVTGSGACVLSPCPPPADLPNRIPWEREQTRNSYFSCISRRVLYIGATWEAPSDFAAGLQFFPVAQTVKNLPAMREMGVRSLGWEDPLEKEW